MKLLTALFASSLLIACTSSSSSPASTDVQGEPVETTAATQPRAASLGTWEGSGIAYDVSGKELGPFTIALTRTSDGPAKTLTEGVVTLADGTRKTFTQSLEAREGGGFRLESSNGAGGGRCFANDMCQSYEERADGHAFATTIVKDGAGRMRVLVTELDKGKAVRFFEQSLSKKP